MESNNSQMPGRSWEPRFQLFIEQHAAKWSTLAKIVEPIYWLPAEVIESLGESSPAGGPSRERRSLLDDGDAEFETAFRQLCQTYAENVVGVWQGRPVMFDLLLPLTSFKDCAAAWTEVQTEKPGKPCKSQIQSFEEIGKLLETSRHTRLGWCGWLNCNQDYISERDALHGKYMGLPDRPLFPLYLAALGGQPCLQEPSDGVKLIRASEETSDFAEHAARFLKSWQLSALVTWDLPLPQDRIDVNAGLLTHLRGPEAPVEFTPFYLPKPSTSQERDRERERQAWEASNRGLGQGFPLTELSARNGQPSQYESAFRMQLIELGAQNRYRHKRGFATRFVNSMEKILGCTPEHAKRIRGKYLQPKRSRHR